ncbi:MAG: oligoribonuclease [Gammaproteobacteria bacterium]
MSGSEKFSKQNLIWIDLEMTGLDTDEDYIIEIATIITDQELNILAEGPMIAIYQPEDILEAMDDWNTNQHGNSGLTERVRQSKYTVEQAEQETLDFLKKYVPSGASPMCGNTICQDRRFMHRLMTKLERYFHYRHIDVSTIKELAERWAPELPKYQKSGNHLAMDDIKDSIEELKYFRKNVMKI